MPSQRPAFLSVDGGVDVNGAAGPPVERVPLTKRCLLGRSGSADLRLADESVSRRHAEVVPQGAGGWVIRDLGSHNGTTVNGVTVNERLLAPGDEIRLGTARLRFELDTPGRPLALPAGIDDGDEGADVPGLSIDSLDRVRRAAGPPRVSSERVAAILEFGRRLQHGEVSRERLDALLALTVSPEMGGQWAYAFHLGHTDHGDGLEVLPLCEPRTSTAGPIPEPRVSRSVLRAVLDKREPVLGSSVGAAASRFQTEFTSAGATSPFGAIACPIASEGDSAADVLYVIVPPALASMEWLMLVSLAVEQYRHAESLAAARETAEARAALDREMSLARSVQSRTLPRRGSSVGLEWAFSFEPSLAVAGDYVDVVTRDDGRVLLLVADASGKGMQAALITSGLHAVFNTAGRKIPLLPDLVAAVDGYLRSFLPGTSFVTLAALLVDPADGTGWCVNCGHPPMIAVGPDGAVRELEGGDNLPLGLCAEPIQATPVALQRGEWVAGYTDGLTEMRNPTGEMLGSGRVREHFRHACAAAPAAPAADIVERTESWLDAFRGDGPAEDDRTFLLARLQR